MATTITGNAYSGRVTTTDTVFTFSAEKQDLRITNNGASLLELIIDGNIIPIESGRFYSNDGYITTFRLRAKGGEGYYNLTASDSAKESISNTNTELDAVKADYENYKNMISKISLGNATAFAQAEKYQFTLRNVDEWDAILNMSPVNGVISPTAQGAARAARALPKSATTNLAIQAKIYYDNTQETAYIGYNNQTAGTAASGTNDRVYVGFSNNGGNGGFALDDLTTYTELVPDAQLTTGWYIITLFILGNKIITSICKEDTVDVKAFVITPHITQATNIQIGGYVLADKIKDLRYFAFKDTTERLLPPIIPNRYNYHTPLTITMSGIPTICHIPASYDPNVKNKVCVWVHGADGYAKTIWMWAGHRLVLTSLLNAGYVVIGTDGTSRNSWGNAQSGTDIKNMIDGYRQYLNLQDEVYVLGESMGGMVSLNAIQKGKIDVKAVTLISPATNLEHVYYNNATLKAQIRTAYGISDDSEFQTKTNGYDPYNDISAEVYKNIPFRIYASPADTVVIKANNTDLFAEKINADGGNVTVVPCTGEHGDISAYHGDEVVSFFDSYY